MRTSLALLSTVLLPVAAMAQPPKHPCARFAAGSTIVEPPSLHSRNGVLRANLSYETDVDDAGRTLYCFVTSDGIESPTLHVRPGDRLQLRITNNVPAQSGGMQMAIAAGKRCGAAVMTSTSVNVHYHGTNTAPTCHSDEVINTMINSGETFDYDVAIPRDEPPGLYWYHPHIHGMSEPAVQGGASGAIVVDGIEELQPQLAGVPARVLIVRDNNVAGNPQAGGAVPSWDLSLNYVPIAYPAMTPAQVTIGPHEKQLWRVLNASADTILDLQLQFDGVVQPLNIVGLDGVPTGSQDGTRRGRTITKSHLRLPPAARAELLVTGPPRGVKNASFLTLNIDTGPLGDNDPQRTIALMRAPGSEELTAAAALPRLPTASRLTPAPQRFEGLATAPCVGQRKLYFSEVVSDPNNPTSPTNFYVTVDGATPTLFDPNNPPAIVTTQGSVEEWTVENRSGENHEFHIHQIHFLLTERNGVPVAKEDQQFLDMVEVPYWTGSGPYPSVKLRMDFRGPDVGDFVYHCHILGHEDNGMMAIIRVQPKHH
jgi:FtsP/CotA-like multicopper oxidase with cupredoxin domain